MSETHIESSLTKLPDTPSSEAEKAALIQTLKEKQVNAWSAAVTATNLSVPSGHRATAGVAIAPFLQDPLRGEPFKTSMGSKQQRTS